MGLRPDARGSRYWEQHPIYMPTLDSPRHVDHHTEAADRSVSSGHCGQYIRDRLPIFKHQFPVLSCGDQGLGSAMNMLQGKHNSLNAIRILVQLSLWPNWIFTITTWQILRVGVFDVTTGQHQPAEAKSTPFSNSCSFETQRHFICKGQYIVNPCSNQWFGPIVLAIDTFEG
jgi:hypothetical protein